MKKLLGVLAGLLCTMLVLFCGCSSNKIPERPEDTNLEFWIVEDVKRFDWSEHEEISGWFGAWQYYGKGYSKADEGGYYVKYLITAWPDYADGGKFVTQIEITDPAITVYGLTVNSTVEEFDTVFQGKGYELDDFKTAIGNRRVARKNGFTFTLDGTNQVFIIVAKVTNRDNIYF